MLELTELEFPTVQYTKANPRDKEFISTALKQAGIEPLSYEQAKQALLDGAVVSAAWTTWKWRIHKGILQSRLGEIGGAFKTCDYSFSEEYEPFYIPETNA